MVPWPSGKAKVCKTFIPQFESGWHLHQDDQLWLVVFLFFAIHTHEKASPAGEALPVPNYSPSITASIRMPTMMMPMNRYCFLDSFSFRKMRDRIRDTTHTAEMMGAAIAPLPLAMA